MRSPVSHISGELLLLIIVFIGIGLTTGILSRSRAFSGVWTVIFIALLWPFATSFATSLYKSLPLWFVVIISIILIPALLRGILSVFFGREATGVFVGELLLRLFALPFRFVGYLFRLVIGRR